MLYPEFPNVYFADEESFKKKLEELRKRGRNHLHVVTDFDRTITPGLDEFRNAGKSSHGLLEMPSCPHVSDAYKKYSLELFYKYFPIEISKEFSVDEKIPLMKEWYAQGHAALIQERLTTNQIRDICMQSKIKPRDGARKFFELLNENDIPVLVFTAGIVTLIEVLIKEVFKMKVDDRLGHFIGNKMLFNENGVNIGFSEPLVHMFNKNESHTKGHDYVQQVKERENLLLLGDGLGDVHMADGIEHHTVLKVGFQNHDIEDLLPKYLAVYDVVITNDGNFQFINDVILKAVLQTETNSRL